MKRRLIWTLVILILAAAGAASGFLLYIGSSLKPMPASKEAKRIVYPAGMSTTELSSLLEAEGLIRSGSVFTWYLKYKKQGARFQAGEYEMTPGLTPDQIIERLNQGQTVKEDTLKLTVPEGYTVRQIAEKLQSIGIGADAFLQAAQQFKGAQGSVAAQIPEQPAIRTRLEGYLFPDTYEWKKDVRPEEIVETMAGELDTKLAQFPDWQAALQKRGLTVHQLLTVASLIEREVALEEERPLVSSVIYNRLQKGMPLQIDATVQYLFDKPKERLLEKDLQLESPYNTYLHPGLPPGPIASPSLASIRAALYPVETKYLFYVTKKDGSKGHLFAETYEQHQKNIADSKKAATP
ncbi:endolytic transglycosylase MltG [Paenibacillus filicis]|uniref:Endolytic murein transglycosylase n=1 Tax=Paenibacillus gyeongsangnamensis TaxID=3388067 RepID=A0ABT4QD02_9BACL|nr:endolytic transglycosylase MltG [Paenibacillus filicis]MCZ8514656.1 endolytic transglycosylase MltG [Paenibacillus filicis]